jgi:hypothetical protein
MLYKNIMVYNKKCSSPNKKVMRPTSVFFIFVYKIKFRGLELGLRCLNAIFNNIPVESWRSVLLVEDTRVPGENH